MVYTPLIIEYLIVFNLFTNFGKMVLLPTPVPFYNRREKGVSVPQTCTAAGAGLALRPPVLR